MIAEQILFSQGFGTRHECTGLIVQGRFRVNGTAVTDPDEDIPTEDLTFEVDGVQWPFFEKAIILLNKPEHYECSLKPIHHPSVLSLLPPPLRVRKVQPVGRLDEDTTGLLLLTDDGKLIHRLTHPKKHVTKIYRVTLKHPVTEKQIAQLLKGVQLADSPDIVKAVSCDKVSELVIDLGITQGKYHQVKRMMAAVSNRVVALERIRFGNLSLPEDLKPGEWTCVKSAQEIIG